MRESAHGVPDLQLDLIVVNADRTRAKLHTNGEVVLCLEALVGELKEEARFADCGVAHNDVFKEKLGKGGQ